MTHRRLSHMTDPRSSAEATSERDGPELDERATESPSKPMHAELCIDCQALVFNERDHFDTMKDHGYRLLCDDSGVLQLEIDKSRYFDLLRLSRKEIVGTYTSLRTQLRRKDTLPSLPSITSTAGAGCRFCICLLSSLLNGRFSIRDTIRAYDMESTETPITIEFFYTSEQSPFQIQYLVAAVSNSIDSLTTLRRLFWVEADMGEPCSRVLNFRTKTFLPNWDYDEKVAAMRNWISHCESSCHPERLGRTLPTRLLDLSSSQGPNQDIRLVHSKHISRPSDCKYAALSHCWGSLDRPPLMTKMGSLDKMLCNIPFASLSANYRDAVRVARGLGIDYLWIDSLCIVQDDAEDWEAEASRMVDVYQQAYVTIIAATGNCCHDGFLDPKASERVKIPYVSSLAGCPIKDTYYLRERHHAIDDILDSSWNQRGWTLQENAFSNRRLFFTQNSFSFVCESKIHLMDGKFSSNYHIQTAKSDLEDACIRGYNYWRPIIEEYTRRKLTFHRDRLPAISAWVQLMSKAFGRYLAGIWDGDLPHGVLWSCEATSSTQTLKERLKFTQKKNFLAPSWSWASQTQSIVHRWSEWDSTRHRHQILEINVSPTGTNPFGKVESGHMAVSGTLQPLPMAPIQRCADSFQSTMDNGYCIRYYMDWWEEKMDVALGQEIERGLVQDVKMLFLALCEDPGYETCACGLLVLPAEVDEEYWRVGVFSIQLKWRDDVRDLPGFDCEWSTVKIV